MLYLEASTAFLWIGLAVSALLVCSSLHSPLTWGEMAGSAMPQLDCSNCSTMEVISFELSSRLELPLIVSKSAFSSLICWGFGDAEDFGKKLLKKFWNAGAVALLSLDAVAVAELERTRSPIEAMQIIFIRNWLRTICDVLLLLMLSCRCCCCCCCL